MTSRVQGCCRDHTMFAWPRFGPTASRPSHESGCRLLRRWLAPRPRRCRGLAEWTVAPLRLRDRGSTVSAAHTDGHRRRVCRQSGFVTAAQVWTGYRGGDIDLDSSGVDPDMAVLRGPRFASDEVIVEVAHRF